MPAPTTPSMLNRVASFSWRMSIIFVSVGLQSLRVKNMIEITTIEITKIAGIPAMIKSFFLVLCILVQEIHREFWYLTVAFLALVNASQI
jgi:hypothetical protein